MRDAAALRVALVGCGLAGRLVTESLVVDERVRVIAAVDPDPAARAWFESFAGGAAVASIAELDGRDLDVIWVTSPTRMHHHHVVEAVGLGADVVVEKPMAVDVADCDAMIATAAAGGRRLIAGGVRSLDPAFRMMRQIVESGAIGALCAVQSNAYTGWLTRPRSAAELDEAEGGGLIYNQAPHQVDVVRTLASGAHVTSVHARAGSWSTRRPGTGFYTADLELEGGVVATLTYNGYGRIDPAEIAPHPRCPKCAERTPWVPTDAGIVVAVCEEGEVRQTAHGLRVTTDAGSRDIDLPTGDANTVVVDLLISGPSADHDGVWGARTQAAVVALVHSARSNQRVVLT